MTENLTDQEIIYGLRHQDSTITRDFFYQTCSMAYDIDNRKYGLIYKDGLDYYSLAHEYYLHLYKRDWKQLEEKKPNFTLRQWTMNGFHYIVLDNLDKYDKKKLEESIEERAEKGKVIFDVPAYNLTHEVEEIVNEICASYYFHDERAQTILRAILLEGKKGKEVADQLGITPAAVSQRYRNMMDTVVIPYFKEHLEMPDLVSYSEDMSLDISYSKRMYSHMHNFEYEEEMRPKRKMRSIVAGSFSLEDHFRKASPSPITLTTPSVIDKLKKNQVVVYGLDVPGLNDDSPTMRTYRPFGAIPRQQGRNGQTYAIPTLLGPVHNMRPYIEALLVEARCNPDTDYLITEIGCGIAGFTPKEVAPLFRDARFMNNVYLPKSFLSV